MSTRSLFPSRPSSEPHARQPPISLREPGDLVHAVPFLVGYADRSDDPFVMATRSGRYLLGMRIDLPILAAGELWPAIGHALNTHGADAINLAAYPAGR